MHNFEVAVFDRPPAYILDPAETICHLHKLYEEQDVVAATARVSSNIRGILSYNLSKPLSASFLKQFDKLEIIVHHGVGYDAIDTEWCASKGIVVTNTPDVLNEEVADLALGLLLATVRQIPQADAFFRAGKWADGTFPLTASLRGRRLGIFGLGRIGSAIAKRAEAFGLQIGYHNRRRVEDCVYQYYSSLAELAEVSDILLLIAPGSAETRHIVNESVLKALGPDGILINVARGSLVDEEALLQALQSNHILAAGLDVYENEPKPHKVFGTLANVVVLPHVGSASIPTRHAMGKLVLDNLQSFIAGNGPLTPVPETPWAEPRLS